MTREMALPAADFASRKTSATDSAASNAKPGQQVRGYVVQPDELGTELLTKWQEFCRAGLHYRSPFYMPHFTLAVGEARKDARVAVIERGSEVVGFLPFNLVRGSIGKPIGGHINDYHGPVLAPGVQLEAQELLRAAGLDAYDYNHLPRDFGNLAKGSHSSAISPQMDLAEGYDVYAERMGSRLTKALREMRRRQRKLESEIGPLRFCFHDTSESAYRQHVEMKSRQYARMGLRTELGAGWIGEVLDRLRQMSDDNFAGVFSTLYAGDRLIAAHFGIRTSDLLHWWFPSYDLDLAKFGPGKSLVNFCAAASGEQGLTTIDFGKGDEDFKLLFGDCEVQLAEGSLARPGSLAGATRAITDRLVAGAEHLPLGKFRAYPRKAVARLISGVALGECA